jgi:hypothetical protein
MKKLFQLAAICLGVLAFQPTFADDAACCPQPAEQACCPADHKCNDCYCLYCHYEPCYYNTWRCCKEPKYCTRKCCRQVPKYYCVQRCRYVPQYYEETCCRYEPEYYDVCDCTYCDKWVCDKKCKYVPRYYWKHECGSNDACCDNNARFDGRYDSNYQGGRYDSNYQGARYDSNSRYNSNACCESNVNYSSTEYSTTSQY